MKRILACLLSVCMVAGAMSGCSKSGGNQQAAKAAPDEIKMVYLTWTGAPKDLQAVQDKVNKDYMIPKYNVKVKLQPINAGAWGDQTNLLLAGDEPVDLMQLFGRNLLTTVNSGQLIPLDDYISKNGSAIKSKVDAMDASLWKGCSVNNKIYTVPLLSRTYGTDFAVEFRADVCKECNITTDHLNTLADLGNVLKILKEKEPDRIPLITNANTIAWQLPTDPGYRTFSNLGYYTCGVVAEDSKDLTVEDYYETKEYRHKIDVVRDWYQKGYLDKNGAVTSNDDAQAMWDAKKVSARLEFWSPGSAPEENTKIITLGTQHEPLTGTGEISIFGWSIPHNSKHADKAMQVLNEIYSNQDLSNLLAWGLEGKHYVKSGTDKREISYPSGVTMQNDGYTNTMWYSFGDAYKGFYMKGTDPNMEKTVVDYNKQKAKSHFYGFNLDVTPIKTEMATTDSVISQYTKPLESGSVDPNVELPKFVKGLNDGGLKANMAEFQKQVRAWAKTNSK